jgi:hypothetical protein
MSPVVFLNPLAGKAKRIDVEKAPATKMQAILDPEHYVALATSSRKSQFDTLER